jgi:hypothetical protein
MYTHITTRNDPVATWYATPHGRRQGEPTCYGGWPGSEELTESSRADASERPNENACRGVDPHLDPA